MKNKKLSLGIVLLLAVAFTAHTQQYDNERDFEIRLRDGKVIITGYTGTKQEIRIPQYRESLLPR